MEKWVFYKLFVLCFIYIAFPTSSIANNGAVSNNMDLLNKFYCHSNTTVNYFDTMHISGDERVYIEQLQNIGIDSPLGFFNVITITYPNTNFPQHAIHIRSGESSKLIVYNHGHGGLPSKNEQFAIDFINNAIQQNFDVLITSMPLVGLNVPEPSKNYWAKFFGNKEQQTIDQSVIVSALHSIYQPIADPDNYFHFFIDPIVLITSKMIERII